MKYCVVLCDGMADYPVQALGGKTPMQAAHKPAMDRLAQKALCGLVKTVPDGMAPGSDVANLSVMGYDPARYYTGRSPLEAVSMGVDLAPGDVAMRCNLVTLSGSGAFEELVMEDYCAGDISTKEAAQLIDAVQQALGGDGFTFHAGVSYRHCLVWHGAPEELGHFTPPHDISGQVIGPHLNRDAAAQPILARMKQSRAILDAHPVNLARIKAGKRPANCLWFWGQGTRPSLPDFREKTGLSGAVISAVDLLKGIGRCAHMQVVEVPGATGYIDTNFAGKAQAAVDALRQGQDFVYLHIEAPDECGHRGETDNKVRAIELIDQQLLTPLLQALEEWEDYRILILPDHPTPLSTRTHASDPVPFLLYQKSRPVAGLSCLSEETAAKTGLVVEQGFTLLDRLIEK